MSDSDHNDASANAGGEGQGRQRRDRWASRRNDGACVYVGNLNFQTGWQELKDKMREVGDVLLVELIVDGNKRPKKPKGSALVTFKSLEDANKAVATMNDVDLDGRKMLVRLYEQGTRPHTIQGNYTREMLATVGVGRPATAPGAAAAAPAQAPAAQPQQQQGKAAAKKAQPPQAPAQQQPAKGHQQPPHAPAAGRGGKQQPAQQQQQQQAGRGRGGSIGGAPFPNTGRGGVPVADRVNLRTDAGFTVRGPQPTQQQPAPPAAQAWGNHHDAAAQQDGGSIPVPRSQRRTKLFISNLPFDCNWRALRDTFAQIGNVRRADIITDANGRSRGMGTIVFETFEEAKKAIDEFDGIEMAGRPMQVRFDRDDTN